MTVVLLWRDQEGDPGTGVLVGVFSDSIQANVVAGRYKERSPGAHLVTTYHEVDAIA